MYLQRMLMLDLLLRPSEKSCKKTGKFLNSDTLLFLWVPNFLNSSNSKDSGKMSLEVPTSEKPVCPWSKTHGPSAWWCNSEIRETVSQTANVPPFRSITKKNLRHTPLVTGWANSSSRVLAEKPHYNVLWKVVKLVLVLSHGQAGIERGFSENKDILSCNMGEDTVKAYRTVYDGVKHMKCEFHDIPVSKELLKSASSHDRGILPFWRTRKKPKK